MDYKKFTLVPKNYRDKDPRALLYLYPETLNVVAYAKSMQRFAFFQSLSIAEDLAKRQGYILLPWSCIHWQRAKEFGADRKIKIGRNSFFLMQPNELTKTEEKKLQIYLSELHQTG